MKCQLYTRGILLLNNKACNQNLNHGSCAEFDAGDCCKNSDTLSDADLVMNGPDEGITMPYTGKQKTNAICRYKERGVMGPGLWSQIVLSHYNGSWELSSQMTNTSNSVWNDEVIGKNRLASPLSQNSFLNMGLHGKKNKPNVAGDASNDVLGAYHKQYLEEKVDFITSKFFNFISEQKLDWRL